MLGKPFIFLKVEKYDKVFRFVHIIRGKKERASHALNHTHPLCFQTKTDYSFKVIISAIEYICRQPRVYLVMHGGGSFN